MKLLLSLNDVTADDIREIFRDMPEVAEAIIEQRNLTPAEIIKIQNRRDATQQPQKAIRFSERIQNE